MISPFLSRTHCHRPTGLTGVTIIIKLLTKRANGFSIFLLQIWIWRLAIIKIQNGDVTTIRSVVQQLLIHIPLRNITHRIFLFILQSQSKLYRILILNHYLLCLGFIREFRNYMGKIYTLKRRIYNYSISRLNINTKVYYLLTKFQIILLHWGVK